MGPIDYTTQVANPFASAAQGYQFGAAIRNDQMQQQQQEAALAQQQQMRSDLLALANNPNPRAQDYTRIATLYPQMAESAMKSWSALNADQQQSELSRRAGIYAALNGGRPEVASSKLMEDAKAKRAAGMEREAGMDEAMAKIIEINPGLARTSVGTWLAAVPGGDKIISGATSLRQEDRADQKLPGEVKKIDAEATKATTDAAIASATAPAAIATAELQPQKIAADMANQEAQQRIAELNAQIAQANSETQRGQLVLERDKLIASQAEKGVTKATDAQSSMDSLVQALGTVDAIKKHPGIGSNWAGLGGPGSITGKLSGFIPGTDRKDLEGLVDTLKSQQFMTAIKQMQGLGALSNTEGEKIASAVASLSLDQSAGAFKNAVGVIEANIRKAQAKLTAQGTALPQQGGGFVMTHPQYGKVTEGDINRLLVQYPGRTREQVLQFLQSTGGK